jgi:hypothetical protein
MLAALAAAPALEAVDVTQQDILTFLNQLLGRLSPAAEGSTVATSTPFPQQVRAYTDPNTTSQQLMQPPPPCSCNTHPEQSSSCFEVLTLLQPRAWHHCLHR